jgi:hypothetical protein
LDFLVFIVHVLCHFFDGLDIGLKRGFEELFYIESGLFVLLFSGEETDYFKSEISLGEEVRDGS